MDKRFYIVKIIAALKSLDCEMCRQVYQLVLGMGGSRIEDAAAQETTREAAGA